MILVKVHKTFFDRHTGILVVLQEYIMKHFTRNMHKVPDLPSKLHLSFFLYLLVCIPTLYPVYVNRYKDENKQCAKLFLIGIRL